MDSGRYDCIICGVNPKPERQEKYNMSIAYAENPFCLVVAGDNEEITSFADLAGRSCSNALNSTAGDLAVSYTHLDVYKRQPQPGPPVHGRQLRHRP